MPVNRVPLAMMVRFSVRLASLLILFVMLAGVPARADAPPAAGATPTPAVEAPKPEIPGAGTPEKPPGAPRRTEAEAPKPETPADPKQPGPPTKGKNGQKRNVEVMKRVESPLNTVASSVQWNAYFDMNKKTPGSLSMLALVPQDLGDLHVIHRATLGMPYVPLSLLTRPGAPAPPAPELGLGDLTYTAYFSPHTPGKFVWGAGPSIGIPTATGRILGTGKFMAGPSVIGVLFTRHMTIGVLATQQWSVAGDPHRSDVSAATIQPVFYYNFPSKWYIVSSPRLYANWNARQSPKWSIPVGGGVGKFFRIGKQVANVSVQGFYHLERPVGALWSVNLQFQLLWPTVKPAKQ